MSTISDCSPPAHARPGDCLAAPAAAGQEVGTLSAADRGYLDSLKPSEAFISALSLDDRLDVEALCVLREMFYFQDRSTQAGQIHSLALSAGIVALHRTLELRGIEA